MITYCIQYKIGGLALLPLLQDNIIENRIIVDAKGPLSGAGKSLSVGTHFVEANESTKAYKITSHPHKFEISKAISLFTGKDISLRFVPHIVLMQRGILVSCYSDMKECYDYQTIRDVYMKYYANKAFVHILDKYMCVETKWIKSSNMCHINFEVNNNELYIFAAIDNLIKGAAGQAIRNMNIMYGFKDNLGLDFIPEFI